MEDRKKKEEEKIKPIIQPKPLIKEPTNKPIFPLTSEVIRRNETRSNLMQTTTGQNNMYYNPWVCSNQNQGGYPNTKGQSPGILPELLDLEQSSSEICQGLINKSMEMNKLLNSIREFCAEGDGEVDDLKNLHNLGRTIQEKMAKMISINEQLMEAIGRQKMKTYLDSIKSDSHNPIQKKT